MKIIGIDLAGKPQNPTGLCLQRNHNIILTTVFSNEEIIEQASVFNPDIIAMDAPLMQGLPRIRKADRLLKKFGAMPPSLTYMKSLTLRGSKLAEHLRTLGDVVEVFPTATAKLLGIYHRDFRKTAYKLGVKVHNKHELDAYLCCLTGKLYFQKETVAVGDHEGTVIIPK